MDSKDIEINDIVTIDTNELQQSKFLVNHKNLTLVQVYFTHKKMLTYTYVKILFYMKVTMYMYLEK